MEPEDPRRVIPPKCQEDHLRKLHTVFLDVLRHREQEVIRYAAILIPAVGGFVYIVVNERLDEMLFCVASVALSLLLFLGSLYTLALGYNYRYLTLFVAKIQCLIGIEPYVLRCWPRHPRKFIENCRVACKDGWLRKIPLIRKHLPLGYLLPPEIIKYYYFACTGGIAFFAIVTCLVTESSCPSRTALAIEWGAFGCALLAPFHYGAKFIRICEGEKNHWPCTESEE